MFLSYNRGCTFFVVPLFTLLPSKMFYFFSQFHHQRCSFHTIEVVLSLFFVVPVFTLLPFRMFDYFYTFTIRDVEFIFGHHWQPCTFVLLCASLILTILCTLSILSLALNYNCVHITNKQSTLMIDNQIKTNQKYENILRDANRVQRNSCSRFLETRETSENLDCFLFLGGWMYTFVLES